MHQMLSYLLYWVHQTHDMISVYHVNIISYSYPTIYQILFLSYPDYQMDPYGLRTKLMIY